MTQTVFDARAAEQLERMYRTPDIVRRRRLVRDALQVQKGASVLDIGCGPGFGTAELLGEVGPTGRVVGVDTSEAMLAAAAHRCGNESTARFQVGSVTSLPFDAASFDRALCVQVLEFVPDTAAALREIYRVLRPGGRGVIWDVDWSTLSWHSTDPQRMRRMLQAWDRHVVHPTLPRTLAASLRAAGFTDVSAQAHGFVTTILDQDSYGGFALGVLEQYLAGLPDLDQAEVRGWADEQRALGARGEYFYSVTQVCLAATRPE